MLRYEIMIQSCSQPLDWLLMSVDLLRPVPAKAADILQTARNPNEQYQPGLWDGPQGTSQHRSPPSPSSNPCLGLCISSFAFLGSEPNQIWAGLQEPSSKGKSQDKGLRGSPQIPSL